MEYPPDKCLWEAASAALVSLLMLWSASAVPRSDVAFLVNACPFTKRGQVPGGVRRSSSDGKRHPCEHDAHNHGVKKREELEALQ